ncbi:Wzz/FepE/Etk N-terminal domain-containing protein [Leptothrix cholodnii]|nr:Wzz/FepE/Etk N-terminal domain-containing protein [Leptothrix cholodnii]
MDLYVMLAALRTRLVLFVLVFVATVAAAAVVAVSLPKTYRATASLLVAESLRGNALPERGAYLQTQADIIKSETVARRVVAALKLADSPQARQAHARTASDGSFEDWLATRWLAAPQVDLAHSSVIRIGVDAPKASTAAETANAYAQAYVELARELRTDNTGRAERLLDTRLTTLRNDLRQAQDRLLDHQRRNGIVSSDARADLRETRLAEVSAQLSRAREQNLDLASRQQHVRQLRQQGSPLDRLNEVQTDSQVQRLSAELEQGEARLQALSQQYGTAYPPYQSQLAENARRRAALDAQINKVLAGLENAAAQGRWRAAALEAELAGQRSRLLAVGSERGELATLTHNVESAQRTYDMAVQGFMVDMVGNELYNSQVSLLSPASVPLEPHAPRIGLLMAAAVVAGALLGLATVVMLELRDRRVRSAVDLRRLTADDSVPLLGVTSRWSPPRQARAASLQPASTLTFQPR